MNLKNDPWIITFNNFDLSQIGLRETLCVLGNGYFATRGAAEEAQINSIHYPATYLASGYNTLESFIVGHTLSNEDLVNFPNWLPLHIQPENYKSTWIDFKILPYLYKLDLIIRHGILKRTLCYADPQGRKFHIISTRFVSMANPHIAAIQYNFKPLNCSGKFIITSSLDGNVINAGVKRYAQLNNLHIKIISREKISDDTILILAKTTHSNIQIALIARTHVIINNQQLFPPSKTHILSNKIHQEFTIDLNKNQSVTIEKIISLYSSKDFAIKNIKSAAITSLFNANRFNILLNKHKIAWSHLWKHCDIEIGTADQEQQLIRFNIFHLLQTISPHSIDYDYGAPARGLHGEAYRGHVFWDELFILPFFIYHFPEIARHLLLYRYRRLEAAKQLAQASGYQGAKYPWQSASNGEEVSQQWHFNPCSSSWDPDYSSMQYHVNSAIAYNIWQYYLCTHDTEFMSSYGAILLLEIAKFWASIAVFNPTRRRYDIKAVMGPDEYHEKYPRAEKPGINNNAYTNIMAVWVLEKALELFTLLPSQRIKEIKQALRIKDSEINRWNNITRNIFIPFHNGIISQFEGYEYLKELDWNKYKKKYGNIERLDRILKKEGDSPDNYQIAKQADTTMLFYLFSNKTLHKIFSKLNYPLTNLVIKNTIKYYLSRTCHGSSLSKLVYSSILIKYQPNLARKYYLHSLKNDMDSKNTTTHEGIHLGVMAGTMTYIIKHYLGLKIDNSLLSFSPNLPDNYKYLKIRFQYFHEEYNIYVDKKKFSITLESRSQPQSIIVNNKLIKLKHGITRGILMNNNSLKKLKDCGQSFWIDYISRDFIKSQEFKTLIDQEGLKGLTSNPILFEKAISESPLYKKDIQEMTDENKNANTIYEILSQQDIQDAADAFRELYDESDGKDGYVSLEVNPHLAYNTEGTIEEARRLWNALNRPNVFIKVPATTEGLPAIKQLISEGININVTLLFDLNRYREVADAYITGLEIRAKEGKSLKRIASVASFFLSRIDTVADPILEKISMQNKNNSILAKKLQGQIAIASAKIAYQNFKEIFNSSRFKKLAEKDANVQRLLWASTGTKNPEYSEIKYIEALICPDTIITIPYDTLKKYRIQGKPKPRLEQDKDNILSDFNRLPDLGVNLDKITQQLEKEGVQKFTVAFDKLIMTLNEYCLKG